VALLGEVRMPTLVLHARADKAIPIEEGRLVASAIPGAEFVELDSANHIFSSTSRHGSASGRPFSHFCSQRTP